MQYFLDYNNTTNEAIEMDEDKKFKIKKYNFDNEYKYIYKDNRLKFLYFIL